MEEEKKTEIIEVEEKKEKKYVFREPTRWWVTLIIFLVELAVAAGVIIFSLWLRDFFTPKVYIDSLTKYRYLADAFTIPGVVYVCIGLMFIAAQHGAFDGLGYVLRRVAKFLLPFIFRKDITYAEYIEEKKSKQKVVHVLSLFIVGVALLIVAVIFIILFYRIYNSK